MKNDRILDKILSPYKENCRYLQSACFKMNAGHPGVTGLFSIKNSCYIDSTGHFNAVEFNICYNQLGYYLLAKCFQNRLLDSFLTWDLDEFYRRQLADVLIVKFSSRFPKMMRSDPFTGQVEIRKIIKKHESLFIKTACQFKDEQDGFSRGDIWIAIRDCLKKG